MTTAHWHLILTHLPIVGVPAGLALLLWGMLKKSEDLKNAALVAFLLCGLLAFFAKQTGEGAEEQIENLPGFSKNIVHQHEEMADKAFLLSAALAITALGTLVVKRRGAVPAPVYPVVLALALATSALMVYTGELGGEIRHTEIRGENPLAVPALSKSDDD